MIDLSVEERLDAHFIAENMGHNLDDKVGGLLKHPRVHIGAQRWRGAYPVLLYYGDTGYLFGHFVLNKGLLTLEEFGEEDHVRYGGNLGHSRSRPAAKGIGRRHRRVRCRCD